MPEVSERIQYLKDLLFEDKREVSLERARLYTESYKQTEGEVPLIRRAKATAHILRNAEITIKKGELVVGRRTKKPRSGVASPEMSPYWINEELETIDSRPQDPFYISEEDKEFFREELYPYWKDNCLKDLINGRLPENVKKAMDDKVVKLNQTDKGQGHIIPSFEKLVNRGLGSIKEEVSQKAAKNPENDFYKAALITLEASQNYIRRYSNLAADKAERETDKERRKELKEISRICSKVAEEKPGNFYEAVQLFWLMNIILQFESNASSISPGRFGQYMYPFYKRDIERGVDEEFIKEILRNLWLQMNDVVFLRSEESAKHFGGFPSGYTIILGGIDERGRDAVNELSYLILDTFADIRLPQPNLGVRINEKTPWEFIMKTAETIALGTGIPQVFNDEVIIPGFLNRGVSLEDARGYSVVGCVELSIPGKTYGLHDISLFNILKVMEITLKERAGEFDTFEEFLKAIKDKIASYVKEMAEGANIVDQAHRDFASTPLLSCFVEDCIEEGKDVSGGGAKYNFSGVQGIGIPNLSDSLYVIKELVFEEEEMELPQLLEVLEDNFTGREEFRQRLINKYAKYGNDIDEVDYLGSEMLSHYCREVEKYENIRGGTFQPGSYTVSAHIPLGEAVGATPDGRLAGDQLADGGLSPMVGRDENGPTAILKSLSKLDTHLTSNGSLLNVKFNPSVLEGRENLSKFAAYLKSFMRLKLQHIQFNVISADTLREAQENPEDYRNLVVRVAGYSALFVDLNKAVQNDIIARTEHTR